MKKSFKNPGEDNQLNETKERLARRKLGQISLSSFPSLSEELSKEYNTDDGLPEEHKSSDYSAIKKRILQLHKEGQDSLKESLEWPVEQRRLEYEKYIDMIPANQLYKASLATGILNYDFSNYSYPERWLDIRETLLSTIAVPDQGTHHTDNTDKHTKSLANALTSAIINLNIPEDTLKRASGILTSKHLPDFAKQMSIFQLIYPISELDLEFTGDYGSFHGEKRTVASGKQHWGKIGSPVLISLIQQQKKSRNNNNNPPEEGRIKAEDGREYATEEVIYYDILKCAFGSNGKTIKSFLSDLENGDTFIEKLHNSDKTKLVGDCFSATEIENSINLIETLNSLYYSQMQSGRKEKEFKDVNLPSLDTIVDSTIGELAEQFKRIEELFGVSSRYTLGDRIVRSFCYPLGIKGIASAYDYLTKHQAEASNKNVQNAAQKDIIHSVENYIYKGVPSVEYLPSILEDGILAKEYLGVGEARDLTPMDADFSTANIVNESYVQEVREYVDSSYMPKTNLDLADALKESIAYMFSGYKDQSGCIIAVKRDHRFQEEREEKSNKPLYSRDKYGIFTTYNWDLDSPTSKSLGIRTGMPSTSIDYLIAYKESADKIVEYVTKNSFYIPIIDFDGNLLLSPKEWLEKAKYPR